MQKLDDEHLTQPGFEPSTSAFRATTGPNEPSVPVNIILSTACISQRMLFNIKHKIIGTRLYRLYLLLHQFRIYAKTTFLYQISIYAKSICVHALFAVEIFY